MFKMTISSRKTNVRAIAFLLAVAAIFALVFAGCASSAPAQNTGPASGGTQPKPAWVDNPKADFPEQRYLAQTGFGGDRQMAEQRALASLTAVFGQSVQSEMKSVMSYAQAMKNGIIEFEENKSMEGQVVTSAEMESLLGAEIPEVWFDGKNIHYAVAVMDKPKVTALYTDLFKSNERVIASLINIPASERNTIFGYSRMLLAGTVADVNRVYANVLTILGGSTGAAAGQQRGGDEYRLQARDIAKTIPIAVSIKGDSTNRVSSAFAKSLSSLGFLSGGNNSRYVLEGEYSVAYATTDAQGNVHVRYSLIANLKDNSGSTVLLPFGINERVGHQDQRQAEELAIRNAEKKINDEFGSALQSFLTASLPKLR